MKLKPCSLCLKLKYLPFYITEIIDGQAISLQACVQCAETYLKNNQYLKPPKITVREKEIDLSQVKSPEDLIAIITGKTDLTCDQCGLQEVEFDKTGKFGCPHCYGAFKERMERQVFPYHGAKSHTGKIPKEHYRRQQLSKPEQVKTLKLRLAKALELENYENAAVIKKQLDELNP